jgi:uncharacterized protein (TIGR03790 family)
MKKLVFISLTMLLCLLSGSSTAQALSPSDLVIVFNRNLPESKGVANYYAQRRGVPAANMVGVDVPDSEDMYRGDYERKLVPPVKAQVEKVRGKGGQPAILLVYGVPLRVGPAAVTKAEEDFKVLAAAKVKEYQGLVMHLAQRLDQLTGAPDSGSIRAQRLSYPVKHVLEMAQASFARGAQYLQKAPRKAVDEPTRAEVISLLVKLGGTSPEADALMKKMSKSEGPERQEIQKQELLVLNAIMRQEVGVGMFRGIMPETAQEIAAAVRFVHGLMGELKFWEEARSLYAASDHRTGAAVDSELTMILAGPYQLASWLPNPFNLAYARLPHINKVKEQTLMVGRLDGPTPEIARRLVDDALETEKAGVSGVFYLDARGLAGQEKTDAYAWFDQHLLNLYTQMKKFSPLKVVLDRRPEVFPPGSCPNAALYCGWHSAATYVPACQWRKGAVGYHVASYEAETLKKPGGNVWCKRMLEEGVAATLGPVAEPYLQSFPLPDQFFPLLMTGKLTLLEVYFLTLPGVSWQMILIGDPLYIPFKNKPAILLPGAKDVKIPDKE